MNEGITIQQERVLALSFGESDVVAAGEAKVFVLLEQSNPGKSLPDHGPGAVFRIVLDNDYFEVGFVPDALKMLQADPKIVSSVPATNTNAKVEILH